MKRSIYSMLCLLSAVFFICACKKKDDSGNNTSASGNFKIGSQGFSESSGADLVTSVFGVPVNELNIQGISSDRNTLGAIALMRTNTARPTAGTYNIGGTLNQMNANQLFLIVVDSSASGQGFYSSDSVTTVNVTLTESGGKLSANLPGIMLKGFFTPTGGGSTYSDSMLVSAAVFEQ